MMNWKKLIGKIGIGVIGLFGGACDSGDIYPDEGNEENVRKIETVCVLKHAETIPTTRERKLMWAAFATKDDLLPIRSERITSASADGSTVATLTQVPKEATYIALVLTDQTSRVLHVFYGQEITSGITDLKLDAGNIDLVSFDRVQHQLFNQSCLQCHMSGNASAGLILEENSSYAAIVGRPAQTAPDRMIVQPGDTLQSEMYLRLNDTEDFHSKFTTLKDDDISLLSVWIQAGAIK